MRLAKRFLVLFLLCPLLFAYDNRFLRLKPTVVIDWAQKAPSDLAERVVMVRDGFQRAGCDAGQITEQAVPGQKAPNILCTLPGTESGTIVIAARLDYRSKGNELVVDSGTLNLLPILVQSLHMTTRRHTLVFAAFSGGDRHLGSAYYLSQLSAEQKKSILGFVFLDHVGRSPARYLFASQANDPDLGHVTARNLDMGGGMEGGLMARRSTHSDNLLRKQFSASAKVVRMEDPNELQEFYFTDALNFEHEKIDALTITSPAYEIIVRDFGKTEIKMMRTELNQQIFYETYNLLCVYVMSLDNDLTLRP